MNSLTKIFNNIYKYHIMIITKNSKNLEGGGVASPGLRLI